MNVAIPLPPCLPTYLSRTNQPSTPSPPNMHTKSQSVLESCQYQTDLCNQSYFSGWLIVLHGKNLIIGHCLLCNSFTHAMLMGTIDLCHVRPFSVTLTFFFFFVLFCFGFFFCLFNFFLDRISCSKKCIVRYGLCNFSNILLLYLSFL